MMAIYPSNKNYIAVIWRDLKSTGSNSSFTYGNKWVYANGRTALSSPTGHFDAVIPPGSSYSRSFNRAKGPDMIVIIHEYFYDAFRQWKDTIESTFLERGTLETNEKKYPELLYMPPMEAFTTDNTGTIAPPYFFAGKWNMLVKAKYFHTDNIRILGEYSFYGFTIAGIESYALCFPNIEQVKQFALAAMRSTTSGYTLNGRYTNSHTFTSNGKTGVIISNGVGEETSFSGNPYVDFFDFVLAGVPETYDDKILYDLYYTDSFMKAQSSTTPNKIVLKNISKSKSLRTRVYPYGGGGVSTYTIPAGGYEYVHALPLPA